MRISDWSSDVCSSDLLGLVVQAGDQRRQHEVALALGQRLAAAGDGAARGLGLLDRIQVGVDRVAAVERAHQVGRVGRVADLLLDLAVGGDQLGQRSEEHTSELQSLMRISYAVFCLKKKKQNKAKTNDMNARNHY